MDTLKEIKKDHRETNYKIEIDQMGIMEAEEHLYNIEDATIKLLALQKTVWKQVVGTIGSFVNHARLTIDLLKCSWNCHNLFTYIFREPASPEPHPPSGCIA